MSGIGQNQHFIGLLLLKPREQWTEEEKNNYNKHLNSFNTYQRFKNKGSHTRWLSTAISSATTIITDKSQSITERDPCIIA